jgi:DNA-binding NarL/FixJ family response regulator
MPSRLSTSAEQPSILLVEDHPIFSSALQTIIGVGMPDFRLIAVGTLQAAKAFLQTEAEPDLILLDLWLPDTHGFEGLIELRRAVAKVPILVLSAFADAAIKEKAVVCGATDFIPKSATKDDLLQTMTEVMSGNAAEHPDLSAPQLDALEASEFLRTRLSSLTQQQLRVLQMLCQGLLNKQIAHALGVGETTVKAHVGAVLRKLCVSSRTQAALQISKLDFNAVLGLYGKRPILQSSTRSTH